ncbi:MAG: ABC transporter permease subunit [Deltaproteobacteria bacterium]|nr:ABC transporter permease subunit [Deltaproteobacteria bacterium]MBI3075412.1 ABC transporter permease subunit [Deltaproteobacteria bacterium]
MRGMYAVFKRELKAYLFSPIAYVVMTIFLVISGYIFYSNLAIFSIISFQAIQQPQFASGLNVSEGVVRPLFGDMGIILVFMAPLLTMRLFAEERKSGTMELLLTFPLRDMEIILGKFFAALVIYLLMVAATAVYPILLLVFGEPELGPLIAGYLGLILMGAAFLALGTWASSLTENQIVAAVIAFGMLLLFWIIGWATSLAPPLLRQILPHVSIIEHYGNFSKGVIATHDLLYYLLFIGFFLFANQIGLESRKWRGRV